MYETLSHVGGFLFFLMCFVVLFVFILGVAIDRYATTRAKKDEFNQWDEETQTDGE